VTARARRVVCDGSDVHTLSQHAFSSAIRYESLGKLLRVRESDWVFYYL
jgi:hypothetical protein